MKSKKMSSEQALWDKHFTEDVKSASVSLTFDYLSRWSLSTSYNAFWGGSGTANALSDRDFVSFNIKYAI